MTYPDFSKSFTLTTDASNIALGSVLSQNNKPIAFHSRTLNTAERNYSTIEKELLAIIDSCKHFRPYLFGQKFTIETDHKPLVWLFSLKEANQRLARWKLRLEEYEFEIIHKKSKENKVADALSRIEINALERSAKEVAKIKIISDKKIRPARKKTQEKTKDEELVDLESVLPQLDENEHLTPQDIEDILNENPFTANNNAQNELLDEMPLLDRLELLTDQTVHTSVENPTNGLIYSEKYLYLFKNKIHMKLDPRYEVKIVEPSHFLVNIQNGSEKEQIKNFMKEYLQPDKTYGIFFENDREKNIGKSSPRNITRNFL